MRDKDIINIKLSSLRDKIVSQELLLSIIRDVLPQGEKKMLKNLRQSNKIKSIFLKYYYILSENERKIGYLNYYSFELVFAILNKLNIKWYISLEKGLELNKLIWQSYRKFTIINNKISRKCTIEGTEFEFKKTKVKYINNYKQNKTKNRITQNVGTNEKILVDYIYFKKKVPEELFENMNSKKVKEILNNYPKNFQKKVKNLIR